MNIFGVSLNTILIWSGLGLIIGLLAYLLDLNKVKGGILGTVITGILGALAGGFLAIFVLNLPFTGINLQSLIVPFIGALILVLLERFVFRDRSHIKTDIERME